MKRRLTRRSLFGLIGAASGAAALAACGATPTPQVIEKVVTSVVEKEVTKLVEGTPQVVKETVVVQEVVKETVVVEQQEPVPTVEPKTLTYWTWWSPTGGTAFRILWDFIKDDFEQTHPGRTLDIQYIPFGDYYTKVLTATATGDVPDAVHASVAWVYGFVEKGALEDLSELCAQTPELAKDQFFPAVSSCTDYYGKTYGVPHEGPTGHALGYNVDHFEEAGVDPSKDNTWKWTWDDFIEAAIALTRRSGDSVERAGFLVPPGTLEWFVQWVQTQGAEFYNQDYSEVAFGDGSGERALQLWYDLLNTHRVSTPISPDRDERATFWGDGASIARFGLYNMTDTAIDAPDLNYDIMPFPIGPGGKGPTCIIFYNMDTMLAGADKELGWEWITYYCGSRVQARRLDLASFVSPRLDVYETQSWTDAVARWPQFGRIPELAALPDVGAAPFVRRPELEEALEPIMDEVIPLGTKSAAQAAAEMIEAGNAVLAK